MEPERRFQILFALEDGLVIETVVIPFKKERSRTTVCVSSQNGLDEHLTTAEIVEQAVYAQRLLSDEVGTIKNVVFMVRNWIMPINRKYNISMLLETLREELRQKHKYKVLFEYVMLAGINDSIDDAKRLIDLVQGIPCKINLLSFNPHSGSQFKPSREEKMIQFRDVLAEAGCVVLLRLSRGDDSMAACGQLGKPGDIQAPILRVPSRFQMALLHD